MLSARDALTLCRLLEEGGVQFWVMGGWGVDALLGRETRPHKDLDILASQTDLVALRALFGAHSFTLKRIWEESRWLGEGAGRWPTAFVAVDAQERELDVHLIEIRPDGSIIQRYDQQWPLPDSISALSARGTIAGEALTCVSKAAQLALHTGYDITDAHRRDLDLLRAE